MKKLFLLLLTTFFLIGCNSDDDTLTNYIGTWSGTYSGSADKGIWNFVVSTDGKVTGTMHSDTNNENFNISGRLSTTGQLTASVGLPSDGQFMGNLNEEKGNGNGNWSNKLKNPATTGTWQGEKNK